jgi:hypothetical protein
MKQQIFTGIKYLSTVLIMGAIGLELWRLYFAFHHLPIPSFLSPLLWLGRFALVAHFIEGVIATVYASRKQKAPIRYGIYTFFVGTIALSELFALEDSTREDNVNP